VVDSHDGGFAKNRGSHHHSRELGMAFEAKFKDRSLRIVAVEQSASLRQLIGDVLRSLGFTNVETMANITDSHHFLEADHADWLILPLQPNDSRNGLNSIRMISSASALRGLKVSLLLAENEDWAIAKAFELGAFTCHPKYTNRDDLKVEFEKLAAKMDTLECDSTKTSMSYLRSHLTKVGRHQDLVELDKNALSIYPGDGESLMNLAESLVLSGENRKADATLRQLELICPDKISNINSMREKISASSLQASSAKVSSDAEESPNFLGLENVVIVDSDDASRSAVKSIIRELGCNNIFDFADGDSAFSWLDQNGEPDLLLMEWRIPKLSGPMLLQRLRSKGHCNKPVIVISSLIKSSDMPIIRELGIANLALKPVEKNTLLKALIWAIQQDRMPSDMYQLENKIRSLLNSKSLQAAEPLVQRYLDDPTIQNARKSILRAEFAFAKEQYDEARDLAIAAVKQSGESLFALNILGKCLMTLRQYESALKCFKKAQTISPMNIERLITMAEVQAELGETATAEASLNMAKDIDPESRVVAEGAARVAIASGSSKDARTALASLESNLNLIRYLNNKAVAHAKCGFPKEGIEIYEKTLVAMPPREYELISIVHYNTALARVRSSDLIGAIRQLEILLATQKTRIHQKATSLKSRIEEAIAQSKNFAILDSDAATGSGNKDLALGASRPASSASTLINGILEYRPGEHCCFLLFKSSVPDGPEIQKALRSELQFKPRKALERGETYDGADGTKVAG
jgi:tetratricopeptide (TPR) repeat protein